VLNLQQFYRLAPQILAQPQSRAVLAGGSVTFSVIAAGAPTPSFQWLFNGTNLAGKTSSTLTLSNVSTNQAGSYVVVVSNSEGMLTSAQALLRVDKVVNLGFRGNWPGFETGDAQDVEVSDGFAYVATTVGLLILDVSDPGAPRRVGGYNSDGPATRVAVKDGFAYLLVSSNQISPATLSRFDVRNPALPRKVAEFIGSDANDFALVPAAPPALPGDLLCVADGQTLLVLNTNCTLRGSLTTTHGTAKAVTVAPPFAYVAWPGLIGKYDLSNPTNPIETALFNESAEQLAALDIYVYGLSGGSGVVQLRVLNVNDPRPLLGGSSNYNALGYADFRGFAVTATNAYVVAAGYNKNALGVYDLGQWPPALIGTNSFAEGSPRRVTVADSFAYVACESGGLKIFDVSNPVNPVPRGRFLTAIRANQVALQGNLAYVLDAGTGFHILDVSDPTNPELLSTYHSTQTPGRIAVKDQYVYLGLDETPVGVTTNLPASLEVVSVADPTGPQQVALLALSSPPRIGDRSTLVTALAVASNLALVASSLHVAGALDQIAAVAIVDISNPASPVSVGRFDFVEPGTEQPVSSQIVTIDLQPPYAYLADSFFGLRVLDLASPANPVQIGSFIEPPTTASAFVQATLGAAASLPVSLCFLTGSYGTDVLDLSQPRNPRRFGTNSLSGTLTRLQSPLAMESSADGLTVFDLLNPTNPIIVGQFGGVYGAVAAEGRYAFAAGDDAGLTILDMGAAFATAPVVLSQPQNVRALPGATVSFHVGAGGTIPLSYQWRFNGADIAGADGPLLTLSNVQSNQAGQYSVQIANASGMTTSAVAVLGVDAPPVVSLESPLDLQVFSNHANITLTAFASDSDGTIARVAFYNGTNSLGMTGGPYTLTWSNVQMGSYSLTAVATDNEGASTVSAPVHLVVTNVEVFQFSRAHYDGYESNGLVTITVQRNSADTAASVTCYTLFGTARPVLEGSGSYFAISNVLLFPSGMTSTNLTIQLVNDLVYRPNPDNLLFSVKLAEPSPNWLLAEPATATITIIDDDPPSSTNSLTDVIFPGPPPAPLGSLQVDVLPGNAQGSWRFEWETAWRNSGSSATGLVPGEYPIELIPRSGFVAQGTNYTLVGGSNALSLSYSSNGLHETGSLSLILLPQAIQTGANLGQWRLQGELGADWYGSGTVISNVPGGFHIAEFNTAAGYATPAPQFVLVSAGITNFSRATYVPSSPASGAGPVALSAFSDITNYLPAGLPYAFNGQLLTDAGYGSGFVVKKHTVLTAAHVVFDAASLSFVTGVKWFFQRHVAEFEPIPQTPRSWFVLAGYAAARTNDIRQGLAPGESSTEARELDVAALSFPEEAGRGGQGGYLVSDSNVQWLASPLMMMLFGYPLQSIPNEDKGKMHAVGPGSFQFELVEDQLYRSYNLHSFSGNSGGPLCLFATNSSGNPFYLPAAVFLGGSNQTIVRAIDRDVVDLINHSEQASAGGANSTDTGAALWTGSGSPAIPALFRVDVRPPDAVIKGAGWRITNSISTNFITGSSVTNVYYLTNCYVPANCLLLNLEFRPVDGFSNPPPTTVQLNPDWHTVTNVINAPYMAIASPAQLAVSPAAGLAFSGYAGGPFSPVAFNYSLSNLGGETMNWLLGSAAPWLSFFPTNGLLAPHAMTNVTVLITNANNLLPGSYSYPLNFFNQTRSLGDTNLPVTLTVAPVLRLSGPVLLSNGSLQFTLSGTPGQSYAIEFSTDLSTWSNLFLLTNSSATTLFTNTQPVGTTRGFYRAKTAN
jgi:hypothetical protein